MGGSRNGAGRSKLCAWRVTGGFHTSTAERGRQWRRALRDVHGGWRFKATTPQLPADAGARWPRRLRVVHGHPTVTPLLGFGPRSPLSSGTSPLQREQLGARFWLFWLLAGLGIRKGYGATHTTPTPRTEPQAGKASSVCGHQRGQRAFHLTIAEHPVSE